MNLDKTPKHDDAIDLEEYFAAGKPIPKGKSYSLRLDKEKYNSNDSELTGRRILALAGKTPERYLLRQKLRGGVEAVGADQTVDLTTAGVERFMTIPNTVTDGDGPQMRRVFKLLPKDEAFLDGLGLRWEAVSDGSTKVVVIYGLAMPQGYNVPQADVHLRLSELYPDTHIDMAYFCPGLARADGRAISAISGMAFDGRTWQQWSRHRTSESAWRPGEDDISTHMALVDHWLAAELRK